MGSRGKTNATICTFDFETDPFERGEIIAPFCCGFWNGTTYHEFWGDNCAEQVARHFLSYEGDCIVYAHNGGRFDFTFLLQWLEPEVVIISNRIVKCRIGRCELRDSYAILPVPLKQAGDKLAIDIQKMHRSRRDANRAEILTYLKQDCLALYDAVCAYRDRFGDKITMASAAMGKLETQVKDETGKPAQFTLQRLSLDNDRLLRQFYFGGRVEAMERGIIRDGWNVYDMTSMYPYVMRRYEHPVSSNWECGVPIEECDFATIDATSKGAFPFRKADGSLSFPHGRGVFKVTGHEIRAAFDLGLCDVHAVINSIRFTSRRTFAPFIDTYSDLRKASRQAGDKTGDLHYKLVMNSSYGRFALNVDKLKEWQILPNGSLPPDQLGERNIVWSGSNIGETHTFWSTPVTDVHKYRSIRNVATGASITGASRSELLRALHRADRPIYCDTDSIFCRSVDVEKGADIGMWKHEAVADEAAIAGKKLYSLFDHGQPVKHASKGSKLTPEEIRRVASGEVIQWKSQTPTMGLAGSQTYMTRTIRRTA